MARPGRKPTNPRHFDVKLEFDTDEEGQRVRDAGGGPWIKSLIRAALNRLPAEPPIRTELVSDDDQVEIRISVPRSQLERLIADAERRAA